MLSCLPYSLVLLGLNGSLLFGRKEVGFFKLKQCWVILIKPFEDLRHDGLSHKLGFVPDLIFFTVKTNGLLFPVVKQNGGPVGPS